MELLIISLSIFFFLKLRNTFSLTTARGAGATPPVLPPLFPSSTHGSCAHKRTRDARDADSRPNPPPSPSLSAYAPAILHNQERAPMGTGAPSSLHGRAHSPERVPLGTGDPSSLARRGDSPERAPLGTGAPSFGQDLTRLRLVAASAFRWAEPRHDQPQEPTQFGPREAQPLHFAREERAERPLVVRDPPQKRPRP